MSPPTGVPCCTSENVHYSQHTPVASGHAGRVQCSSIKMRKFSDALTGPALLPGGAEDYALREKLRYLVRTALPVKSGKLQTLRARPRFFGQVADFSGKVVIMREVQNLNEANPCAG